MPTALIFRTNLLPISETFILAQAKALTRFTPHFAGLRRCTPTLGLPSDPVVLAPDNRISQAMRRLAFEIAGVGGTFYRSLKQCEPKLIHAHFAIDGVAALPIVKELKLPLIVTLHGYDVTLKESALKTFQAGRAFLRRRNQLFESATMFLCVSDFIRNKAIEAGFPESKLRVHYTGIDLSLFTPLPNDRIPGAVLFVGRLVEKKGCEYLLKAMASVKRRMHGSELIVIGDGPLRSDLEALSQSQGVQCRFLGAQSSESIRYWMSRSKLLCVPSVTASSGDSEGFGMVFAEAQAMGTPVVSFAHGGIPEAVKHGATGLLAPERDEHTLADYILTFLNDDVLWNEYSNNAIRSVHAHCSLAKQTSVLETLYERSTSRPNIPAH